MNTFDERHGGPFDRGRADYYYNRGVNPHYYVGATKASALVKESAMLPTETEAYMLIITLSSSDRLGVVWCFK